MKRQRKRKQLQKKSESAESGVEEKTVAEPVKVEEAVVSKGKVTET